MNIINLVGDLTANGFDVYSFNSDFNTMLFKDTTIETMIRAKDYLIEQTDFKVLITLEVEEIDTFRIVLKQV